MVPMGEGYGRSMQWVSSGSKEKMEGEEGDEECGWAGDVWNNLIPSNMSTLAWRLLHKRLSTKENLLKRGMSLNSSAFCVGGCGSPETEDRLFFNCPMLGAIWREIVGWLGIPTHLHILKNLVPGNVVTRDKIRII
jgi:hypothetical protein